VRERRKERRERGKEGGTERIAFTQRSFLSLSPAPG